MGERNTFGNQRVDGWCADVLISQCADRVKTLLIGAVPKDVGSVGHLVIVVMVVMRNLAGKRLAVDFEHQGSFGVVFHPLA